jgi:hypothetical protein
MFKKHEPYDEEKYYIYYWRLNSHTNLLSEIYANGRLEVKP